MPDYARLIKYTVYIVEFVLSGITAYLMFEHHKPLWGVALIISMLIVLRMNLVKCRIRSNKQ